LDVTANGTAPFTYQWKKDGVDISGATAISYVISNVTTAASGNYTVLVSNSLGNSLSNIATLTVVNAPVFTIQPVVTASSVGQSFTLSSLATGDSPPTYQWYKNNVAILGATSATYTVSSVVLADVGTYKVTASNTVGGTLVSTDSNAISVTVSEVLVPPTFTTQPVATTVNLTQPFTLSALATGVPSPSYRWYKNNVVIEGATSTSYTVSSAVSTDSGNYKVVATNTLNGASSSVDSNTVTVNIIGTLKAPIFTIQPVATSVEFGNTLTLSSFASVSVYFYTVGTDNNIYEISDTGTKRAVRDVSTLVGATSTNAINGIAFDSARGHVFFVAPNPSGSGLGSLWYWNQVTNSTPFNLGQLTTSRPDNGTYWNNAYWYIMPGTHTLVRVALQYDGSGTPTMVSNGISSATLTGGIPTTNNNYIGDIAITSNGTLYATVSNGSMFYNLTLPSGPLSGTIAAANIGTVGSPIVGRLQIAFGPAGTALYGQSFDTGQWYTVNTSNGILTLLSYSTIINGGTTGFQDVSGVSATPSPPATDAGAGTISYQWYRNDIAISGATSATYTVASVVINTGGTYKVVATRTFDGMTSSTNSDSALVTVTGISPPSNVRITILVGP
jgi:TATA-box binding protein (TBP) (component of TFIID and TFIIIB)